MSLLYRLPIVFAFNLYKMYNKNLPKLNAFVCVLFYVLNANGNCTFDGINQIITQLQSNKYKKKITIE